MSRQTASQRASLAPYRMVKAREGAIFRSQAARRWLQRGFLALLAAAMLGGAVLVGFLAGLTAAPKYYGIELGGEVAWHHKRGMSNLDADIQQVLTYPLIPCNQKPRAFASRRGSPTPAGGAA